MAGDRPHTTSQVSALLLSLDGAVTKWSVTESETGEWFCRCCWERGFHRECSEAARLLVVTLATGKGELSLKAVRFVSTTKPQKESGWTLTTVSSRANIACVHERNGDEADGRKLLAKEQSGSELSVQPTVCINGSPDTSSVARSVIIVTVPKQRKRQAGKHVQSAGPSEDFSPWSVGAVLPLPSEWDRARHAMLCIIIGTALSPSLSELKGTPSEDESRPENVENVLISPEFAGLVWLWLVLTQVFIFMLRFWASEGAVMLAVRSLPMKCGKKKEKMVGSWCSIHQALAMRRALVKLHVHATMIHAER